MAYCIGSSHHPALLWRFCDSGTFYTGWSKKADTRVTVWVSAFLDHPVDVMAYLASFVEQFADKCMCGRSLATDSLDDI